jgi:hypothetical protein
MVRKKVKTEAPAPVAEATNGKKRSADEANGEDEAEEGEAKKVRVGEQA